MLKETVFCVILGGDESILAGLAGSRLGRRWGGGSAACDISFLVAFRFTIIVRFDETHKPK